MCSANHEGEVILGMFRSELLSLCSVKYSCLRDCFCAERVVLGQHNHKEKSALLQNALKGEQTIS